MAVGGGFSDPASKVAAVTPSDDTDLTGTRGLYIGGDGDVLIRTIFTDSTVTFAAVPAGSILPVQATRVMAATTATNIVALY